MILKVWLVFIALLQIATNVEMKGLTKNIGCHKILGKSIGCHFESKEVERQFINKISESLANAVEWLRQEQKSNIWFSIHTTSWVLQSLVLAGYVSDNGLCSETVHKANLGIESANEIAELSAGRLAMIMIGLRATCKDVTKFQGENLVEILMEKMDQYPIDDFNNYYQYSLGVIALYVNGMDLPLNYGETILKKLATGVKSLHYQSSNLEYMGDTEALSLIALSAMSRQRSLSKSFLYQVEKLLNEAESKIDRIMVNTKLENLVTITHVLQVLQSRKIKLSSKPYCKKALDWILNKQDISGSFEGLMPTATLLPLLSERSILELRNEQCPIKTDDVNSKKIKDFVTSRVTQKPTEAPPSDTQIKVTVNVASSVPGVNFDTENVTVSLVSGATALDALREASKYDYCFHFRVKQTAWGPSIEMVCNVEINHIKKAYWMFYVNGKSAQVGAGSFKVSDGDFIIFKYEAFSF